MSIGEDIAASPAQQEALNLFESKVAEISFGERLSLAQHLSESANELDYSKLLLLYLRGEQEVKNRVRLSSVAACEVRFEEFVGASAVRGLEFTPVDRGEPRIRHRGGPPIRHRGGPPIRHRGGPRIRHRGGPPIKHGECYQGRFPPDPRPGPPAPPPR